MAALFWLQSVNTLRPRQNGRRFADDTFKRIFLNENARISIKISLKFVPKGPINNNPTLVQIMAWRRSDDKPLSETMMVSLLTHICVTRPQWVNAFKTTAFGGISPAQYYDSNHAGYSRTQLTNISFSCHHFLLLESLRVDHELFVGSSKKCFEHWITWPCPVVKAF